MDLLLRIFGFGMPDMTVEKAENLEQKGKFCIAAGKVGRGISCYRKAAQIFFYRDSTDDFQRVMNTLKFLSLNLDRERRNLLEKHLIDTGRMHFEQGKKLDHRRKTLNAIKEYKLALAFWPDNPKILSNLGYNYGQLGDAASELMCYQKAVKLDPSYHIAFENLLITFFEQDRESDARAFLRDELGLSDKEINTLITKEKKAMNRNP